jgi:hypothetical protein
VRLPTTEVRLEVDDGHATAMHDALRGLSQQLVQANGQIRPSEELNRLCIFGETLAKVHLMKVRRKLGKSKLSLSYVVVGLDHVAPRQKARGRFCEQRIRFWCHLLGLGFEPLAHQVVLGCTDLGCFWRVDQREKPLYRVE